MSEVSDASAIILRSMAENWTGVSQSAWRGAAEQAADRIETLGAENARLRAALEGALSLCKFCPGTGTKGIADVTTFALVGEEICPHCSPYRAALEAQNEPD